MCDVAPVEEGMRRTYRQIVNRPRHLGEGFDGGTGDPGWLEEEASPVLRGAQGDGTVREGVWVWSAGSVRRRP